MFYYAKKFKRINYAIHAVRSITRTGNFMKPAAGDKCQTMGIIPEKCQIFKSIFGNVGFFPVVMTVVKPYIP